MAFSLSARLGLKRPLAGHQFSRQEEYDNLTLLDAYPGMYPCTSAARPVGWGAGQTGMFIIETDTGLIWRWNGTVFLRQNPKGLLADVVTVLADFTTAATAPTVAISCPVTVPATNAGSITKRIRIEASCYAVENGTDTTLGAAEISITSDGVVIAQKRVTGRAATDTDYLDWAIGHTLTAWDNPTAGAHTYAFRINSIPAVGGTTVMKASATQPAQLAVTEMGL